MLYRFILIFCVVFDVSADSNLEVVTEIINEDDSTDLIIDLYANNVTDINNITIIENSTDINSEDVTEIFNTASTTAAPTKSKDTKGGKNIKYKTGIDEKHCHCDLTKFSCDVNCCCDADCIESDKQIFTECLIEDRFISNPNINYCYNKNLIYKDRLPMILQKQPDMLFCVIKENLPPILKSDHYKTFKSIEEMNRLTKNHFIWSNTKRNAEISFDTSKPYSYKDEVWIIINSTLQLFEFPSNDINIYCTAYKKVKYLYNQKSYCIRNFNESKILEVFNNFEDMYLISSPESMNDTWISNPKECPLNICIPFEGYSCDLYNCILINKTKDNITMSCEGMICKNVINSLRYELFSNGSIGFTKIKLFFGLTNTSKHIKYIEEIYEIKHVWIPKNSSHRIRYLSGNVGYKNSMPIITSRTIKVKIDNVTDITFDSYDYFSTENSYPLRNVLYLPENKDGICITSNATYNSILFNENVENRCRFKYKLNLKDDEVNATVLCQKIQKEIYHLITYREETENVSKLFVATLGNPSENYKDWIEIITNPNSDDITGSFSEIDNSVICKNVVSKMLYEFAFAYVDSGNDHKMAKLFGATIKRIPEENSIFTIVNNELSIDLIVNVMFYDITENQKVEYAKGPHFHIHLPNDFFYPFTYNFVTRLKPSLLIASFFSIYIYIFQYIHILM